MRVIKLVVALVLSGALVGANLLFKDRLAERALEAALEGVFGGRAEVDGLHLSLIRGRVSFDGLAVADKEAPMTNLFQLGPTGAALNVPQLLRRKVVIESVACNDIRWGTPRTVSGALPAAPAGAASSGQSGSAAPGAGLALPGLDALGFDPAALLAREKANLKSPAALEKADASIKQASDKWQERTTSLTQKTDKLADGVATLQKIDFKAVKSVDEARKAYQAVEDLAPVANDLQKEVKSATADLQADSAALRSSVTSANALLDEDVRMIRSRVALPEGGIKGAVSGLARQAAEARLGKFSSLAFRALEAAGKLRENAEDAKKAPPARRAGRDVPFPTTVYPVFLLKSFAFSVKPEGALLQGEIRDVSSNPELLGRPAAFAATWRSGARTVEARGEIDARESTTRARIEAKGAGMDFDLKGVPWVDTASGTYSFETTADVDKEAVSGKALVTTGTVRTGEARDMAGRVAKDAIAGARAITLDIGYRASGGAFALSLSSNLDDEVGRQLNARLAELKADYQKQAEAQLRKSLAPQLSGMQERLGALDRNGGQLGAIGGRTDGYRKDIDKKKSEYSAALTRLGGDRLKLPGF
jgi:uncharacterized protein (TIGR03545 family)